MHLIPRRLKLRETLQSVQLRPLFSFLVLILFAMLMPIVDAAFNAFEQMHFQQQDQQQPQQQPVQLQPQTQPLHSRSGLLDEQTAALYRDRFNDYVQRRQQMLLSDKRASQALALAPHELDSSSSNFPYALTTESWFKPKTNQDHDSHFTDKFQDDKSAYNDEALQQYEINAEPRKMSDVYRGDFAAVASLDSGQGFASEPESFNGLNAAAVSPSWNSMAGLNSAGSLSGLDGASVDVEPNANLNYGAEVGGYLGNNPRYGPMSNIVKSLYQQFEEPVPQPQAKPQPTSATAPNTYSIYDYPRFDNKLSKKPDNFMPYSLLKSVTSRPRNRTLAYGVNPHEGTFGVTTQQMQRQQQIDAAFKSAEQALGFLPKPAQKKYPYVDELIEKLSTSQEEKDVLKKSSQYPQRSMAPTTFEYGENAGAALAKPYEPLQMHSGFESDLGYGSMRPASAWLGPVRPYYKPSNNELYAPSQQYAAPTLSNYHDYRVANDMPRQADSFYNGISPALQQRPLPLQQQSYYAAPQAAQEQRFKYESPPPYAASFYRNFNTNPSPDDNEDYFDISEDVNEMKRLAALDLNKPETLHTNYNPNMRFHRAGLLGDTERMPATKQQPLFSLPNVEHPEWDEQLGQQQWPTYQAPQQSSFNFNDDSGAMPMTAFNYDRQQSTDWLGKGQSRFDKVDGDGSAAAKKRYVPHNAISHRDDTIRNDNVEQFHEYEFVDEMETIEDYYDASSS